MFTPKRPEATCLIADRRESPFASRSYRTGSSPPSPVFDLPPMRFIAMASVECASCEIEPSDIAPVAKRFTISLAGSTDGDAIRQAFYKIDKYDGLIKVYARPFSTGTHDALGENDYVWAQFIDNRILPVAATN